MSETLSPISRRRGSSWGTSRMSPISSPPWFPGRRSKRRCRPVDKADARESRARGIDAEDVARFEELGEDWWDLSGPMRALHAINPVRVSYIRDAVARRGTFEGARI